jgi:hypothetical protein
MMRIWLDICEEFFGAIDDALGDFFLFGDYNVSINLWMSVDVMLARCSVQCASFRSEIKDECLILHHTNLAGEPQEM